MKTLLKNPIVSWAVKLIFTLGAFYWVFQQVHWQELKTAYASQDSRYLWLAAMAIMGQIVFGALRWQMVLVALGGWAFPWVRVLRIYYASSFFNSCMPSTIGGDIARVWLARSHQSSTRQVIYSVIIDRVMSLASLLALTLVTLPWLFIYLGQDSHNGLMLSLIFAGFALALLWLAQMSLPKLAVSPRFALLHDACQSLLGLLTQRLRLSTSLLFGIFAHISYCLAAYAIALSLSIPVGFLTYLVLVPWVLLLATLPISLGGWGLREMGMTSALAWVGVAHAPALLIALQLGALNTLISAFGGLLYLTYKKSYNR